MCRILLYCKFSYPQLFRLPLVTSVTMFLGACVILSYLQVTIGYQRYRDFWYMCRILLYFKSGYNFTMMCGMILQVTCT